MNYTLQLQPGQTQPVNRSGDFFAIVFAPTDVFVKVPGSEEVLYGQGDSLTLSPGEQFTRLEIRNPTTRAITVTIYAGTGRYEQRRQTVVEPQTVVRAVSGILAANTDLLLDATLSGGEIRQKAVTVSNVDPGLNLLLCDSAGVPFLVIGPASERIIPVSETVILRNPNPAAVSYHAGRIVWSA